MRKKFANRKNQAQKSEVEFKNTWEKEARFGAAALLEGKPIQPRSTVLKQEANLLKGVFEYWGEKKTST